MQPGDRVRLTGLVTRSELNEQQGTVTQVGSERATVRLDSGLTVSAMHSTCRPNREPVEPEPEPRTRPPACTSPHVLALASTGLVAAVCTEPTSLAKWRSPASGGPRGASRQGSRSRSPTIAYPRLSGWRFGGALGMAGAVRGELAASPAGGASRPDGVADGASRPDAWREPAASPLLQQWPDDRQMAWLMATGSNRIPLGRRHAGGGPATASRLDRPDADGADLCMECRDVPVCPPGLYVPWGGETCGTLCLECEIRLFSPLSWTGHDYFVE